MEGRSKIFESANKLMWRRHTDESANKVKSRINQLRNRKNKQITLKDIITYETSRKTTIKLEGIEHNTRSQEHHET